MSTRLLLALLLVGAGWTASAPRLLLNAGLTIELPSGWMVDSVADSRGKPSYLWHPIDSLPRVLMGAELYDSVPADSTSEWTYTMSYAHKITVENDACLSGEVLSWSYYAQDGLPGAFVNSYLTLDAYCQGDVLAWQDRFFATGTHGWQLWFAGDTNEILSRYGHYSALLDSVKVDRSWKGWSAMGVARSAKAGSSLRWSVAAGMLTLQGQPHAHGWLLDSRGRPVRPLRLDRTGTARVAMVHLPSGIYHARLVGPKATRHSATLSLVR